MFRLKFLLFVLVSLLFGSLNANARVCFLPNADGSENCADVGFLTSPSCPSCGVCEYPKYGTKPCKCGEEELNLYRPGDCCIGRVCESNQICAVSVGKNTNSSFYRNGTYYVKVENKSMCRTQNNDDSTGVWVCPETASCVCGPDYKWTEETCKNSGANHVVKGNKCTDDSGEYWTDCGCPDDFYECNGSKLDGITGPSFGTGERCVELDGTVKYTRCECATGDGWSTTEKETCCGTRKQCTGWETHNTPAKVNLPTLYKCEEKHELDPVCLCAIDRKDGCTVGCLDDDYDYIGPELSNIVFNSKQTNLAGDGICAKGPCCATGYWDKTDFCSETTCAALGYNATSCSADQKVLSCPCDTSKKLCI